MKINFLRFNPCFPILFLLACSPLLAQQDLRISSEYTIPAGTTLEVDDLVIAKDGILQVDGTLKVHGNMSMDHNNSGFRMGPSAYVVVSGNFHGANKVYLEISSYLIIYGNFTKQGSHNHGSIDVTHGNIYIFGEVSRNWTDFDYCGDYVGDTMDIHYENCDYGRDVDYERNLEDFPAELKELLQCYDLNSITDAEVCPGGDAVFRVSYEQGVDYRWQERLPGKEEWRDLPGETEAVLDVSNVAQSQHGASYRVIATPRANGSSCKIAISPTVQLWVSQGALTWTGTSNSDWNNPSNWSCNTVPTFDSDVVIPGGLGQYPIIYAGGANAKVADLTIEEGARVAVRENWLQIGGGFVNEGSLRIATGSLAFVGGEAQTFSAGNIVGNRVANLMVNNPFGVELQGKLEVTATVRVQRGVLKTGNGLVLVSTEEQTALIDGAGAGQVRGEVTVQRYLDEAFGYKYLSSPVENSKVGDFASYVDLNQDFPSVYSYDENREDSNGNDLTGWEAYTNPLSPLHAMRGYAINFGDKKRPVTVSLKGEVNNGPQNIVLSNNNGKFTKGFNLVGNPYPSPIDWDARGWIKNNIDDAIYFFSASEDSQYLGTYKSYVTGISSDGSKNTGGSIIPSMQGFFVHVSDSEEYPVRASLGMTNAVRVTDFQQKFYKDAQSTANEPFLIRLSARFVTAEVADPAVVYFNRSATASFEKHLDALKMMNTDVDVPNLYSLTPLNRKLSINAMKFSAAGDARIALGIGAERSGTVKIHLQDLENMPSGFSVHLIDMEKEISTNLSKEEEYQFQMSKGTNDSRFELLISKDPLDDVAIAFNEPFSVLSKRGDVQVNLNLEEGQEATVRLISLSGQVLGVRKGTGREQVKIEGINSTGVYILTMELEGVRHTKKILVR